MKKKIPIILLILVLLIIGFYLFRPAGAIHSYRSNKILLNSFSILKDINSADNCRYFKPTTFLEKNDAHFECLSSDWFSEEDKEIEIKRVTQIIESKGWKPTTNNFLYMTEVSFYKGDLRLNVQVYDWDSERKDGKYRLIVDFRHLVFSNYDFDPR